MLFGILAPKAQTVGSDRRMGALLPRRGGQGGHSPQGPSSLQGRLGFLVDNSGEGPPGKVNVTDKGLGATTSLDDWRLADGPLWLVDGSEGERRGL